MNIADLIKEWCLEQGYTYQEPFDYHPDSRSFIEINHSVILKLFQGEVSYLSHRYSGRVNPSEIKRVFLGDASDPEFFVKLKRLIEDASA